MNTQISEVFDFSLMPVTLPNIAALRRLAVSDSGFLFDPVNGESYTVNSSGLAILRLLINGSDFHDIVEVIRKDYDIDPRKVESDISDFIIQLRRHYG